MGEGLAITKAAQRSDFLSKKLHDQDKELRQGLFAIVCFDLEQSLRIKMRNEEGVEEATECD